MEKEDREMLIRIDQKVIAIDKALSDPPPYGAVVEKVKTHGKVIWLTIALSLTAAFKAFFGGPQ